MTSYVGSSVVVERIRFFFLEGGREEGRASRVRVLLLFQSRWSGANVLASPFSSPFFL